MLWKRESFDIMTVGATYTGGGQKKVAPHQKWFTSIIMAINNKNVNKTNVVVFTCVAVCKPKQYL